MGGIENFSANSQNIKRFHFAQRSKSLIILVIIAVPVVLGYLAYSTYKRATTDQSLANANTQKAQQNSTTVTQNPNGVVSPTAPVASTPSTPGNSTATTNSNNPGSAAPTQSNVMPQGVATAINSIEANGIKGNPYVSSSLDTSSVPAGTTVSFNRSTWVQSSQTFGAVDAVVNVLGQAHSSSVTFSIVDGTWKVTGYSLSQ